MKPDSPASRAAFEQYMGDYGLKIDQGASEAYQAPYTRVAWDVWQAALAFADKRTPEYPASPAEIASYLDDLSRRMRICGTAMDYFGGFGTMGVHGQEMVGAAGIVQGWADGIRAEMQERPA